MISERRENVLGTELRVVRCSAVIIGSGAAAFNAALCLKEGAQDSPLDILLVTEGMNMGTSRNTGSDKQTYYKQSTGINFPDSAGLMAEDYFSCGSMHGDTALVEAANSLKSFFRLVSLGVPFPSDPYGEYTGYKTDHDVRARATSCGPLTSKYMTEALEKAVRSENIPMLDGYRAVKVLRENGRAAGVVCISENEASSGNPAGVTVILAGNVIWATGGPSAVYHNSVYPESQNCSLGAPMIAGATAANLTESQYGIASVKFRWNLSGSYQQVMPRYVSVGEDGEREFLFDLMGDAYPEKVFKKGYEWPFDPSKLTAGSGSSRVDIAVFREISAGRRVYMDFRRNPTPIDEKGLTEENVGHEAYDYLARCGSLGETPVARLRQMNEKAYILYLDHGIDLEREMLEIGVSAQHLNGGLECDLNYENPGLPGLFPAGECAGVFGIKRPGGSALNSTQVSSYRAAECICGRRDPSPELTDGIIRQAGEVLSAAGAIAEGGMGTEEVLAKRAEDAKLHDGCAAFIRNGEAIEDLLIRTKAEADRFWEENRAADYRAFEQLYINYDVLLTRYAMLSAIKSYIADGGLSRGSYLIGTGEIPEKLETDTKHFGSVLVTSLSNGKDGISSSSSFVPVRPVPKVDNTFENVYNAFGRKNRV